MAATNMCPQKRPVQPFDGQQGAPAAYVTVCTAWHHAVLIQMWCIYIRTVRTAAAVRRGGLVKNYCAGCGYWRAFRKGGGVGQLQPAGRSLAQAVCMLAACKPHTSMHDVVFTYVDCASSLQQNSSGVFHKCNSNICNPGSGCSTGASHRRCTDDFLPVLY